MNKSIYIILALVGILVMNSCSDDEFLSGNPDMELGTGKVSALYGDSLPFTIKASDVDVPLSTLKAKLFYGEELVSEEYPFHYYGNGAGGCFVPTGLPLCHFG